MSRSMVTVVWNCLPMIFLRIEGAQSRIGHAVPRVDEHRHAQAVDRRPRGLKARLVERAVADGGAGLDADRAGGNALLEHLDGAIGR